MVGPFVMCLLKVSDPAVGSWSRWGALGIFFVMALSDALDGYLARSRNQATSLGAFLDPLADKLMITCASIILAMPALAVKGFQLPQSVVVLIVGKDILLLMGFAVTYFLTDKIYIKPVLAGKLCTFFQICMVLGILLGPELTKIIAFWPIIARVLWWGTGFWAVAATFIYIHHGIRYIDQFGKKEEPKTDK
jgi:cardiolipin synthase